MKLPKWARSWKLQLARVAVGLLFLVSSLSLTWGIKLSIDRDTDWGTAIQAAASLVLVGVTTFYAFQNRQLIRLHETTPRRTAQEAAVRELMRTLETEGRTLDDLLGHYPLTPEKVESEDATIKEALQGIRGLADKLHAIATQLPPNLVVLTYRAGTALVRADTALLKLQNGVLAEKKTALEQGREWTPERARAAFYSSRSPGDQTEWEDLVEGKAAKFAESLVDRVRKGATSFLWSELPSG